MIYDSRGKGAIEKNTKKIFNSSDLSMEETLAGIVQLGLQVGLTQEYSSLMDSTETTDNTGLSEGPNSTKRKLKSWKRRAIAIV